MNQNIDPNEVNKFDELAKTWWDTEGEFKPLHDINPLRLDYIARRTTLSGARILDVGCGGGILSEALAKAGAIVTGTDMAAKPLEVARLHQYESGLTITYVQTTIEEYAEQHPGEFDVVTCLEMLEHVPQPASIVSACQKLLKPGGDLFLSTINRNLKAYGLMVLGAEYIMRMVPRGTHNYDKFIRPSELASWLRQSSLSIKDISGMSYNPLTKKYKISQDTDVNYFVHASK